MKSSQLVSLLERGISVQVAKRHGIIERYHLTSDGQVAVSFEGPAVCMYCGRVHLDRECACRKVLEVLSLTGAFRHLNEIAERTGSALYDSKTRQLMLSEEGVVSC